MDIALWQAQGRGSVLRSSQHHTCCRGGNGLQACLLGARSWSRGATTLCRASPPVVPGVLPEPCSLLAPPPAHHPSMECSPLYFIPSPLSFHLILVLPDLIFFLCKTVLMSLEHQMIFSVMTFTTYIVFLNRMYVQAQVLEISRYS